ncbi:MAG: EF-P 5-aminopentanol modification-associated protein YfmF, partial [Acetanaerobacterium sp.]
LPLQRETATTNALLCAMLRKCSSEYNSFMDINARLADLYGAYLDSDVLKIGENQGISLFVTAIDDRFALDGEAVTQESARLLCSLLLKPGISDGAFPEKELVVEKQVLIDQIESEINEKRSYAIMQCSKHMCADEQFAVPRYGYKQDVPSITGKGLADAYKNMIANASIEIFFTGCGDPGAAKVIFSEAFSQIARTSDYTLSTEIRHDVDKVREVTERMDIAQSKLVLGFRAGASVADEQKSLVAFLASAVYGATPTSKLFRNVREKLSLCYYCAARYDRYKGIMMVDCGIEGANMQKARDEILHQLDEMRNGSISEDELKNAVLAIKNGYNAVFDSTKSVETYYLGQIFAGTARDPVEVIAQLESITIKDLEQAAGNILLDTVYFLTGEKTEE